MGSPLYLQAVATSCNVNPAAAETLAIQVRSQLAGDTETFNAIETGAGTGIFQILPNVPTADGALVPVVVGNGVLEVLVDDTVVATLTDCGSGVSVQTLILIDPQGVVFDSQTNQPVAGATVTLIDVSGAGNGNPGGPATVFQADGVTPAPATLTTAANGRFEFPLVPASDYRLAVVPPAGLSFPSLIPPSGQPPGRTVLAGSSYGGVFTISAALGPLTLDLPVDDLGSGAAGGQSLFVEKSPSRDAVEVGEFLDYEIEVRNVGPFPFASMTVEDILPRGFRYESGTARLDGLPLPDPAGGAGPRLVFDIGTLGGNDTVTLRYRVFVGPGANTGDGINSATARSAATPGIFSNTARARVRVVEGVFSERAFIVGKVFVDRDGNGLQGNGEPGIPGVALWLEDGTYAITDLEGAYSFYGVRPRTHVLKVDRTTLPPDAMLVALSHRNALDPGSRFIDLKQGELHRADFAEGSASPSVLAAIGERRQRLLEESGELDLLAESELRTEEPILYDTNLRGRPASGVVDRTGTQPTNPAAATYSAPDPDAPAPKLPNRRTEERPAVEAVLDEVDAEAAILFPRDGAVLDSGTAVVMVKGRAGTTLALRVNGELVPENQVGQRSVHGAKQLQVWEYVAVSLEPGENELELAEIDPFGNPRGTHAVRVRTPGELAAVRLEFPAEGAVADPTQLVPIVVHVEDRAGIPVRAPTPVTLETRLGGWKTEDLDDIEPGLQLIVVGGEAVATLTPPNNPGDVEIRATSGEFSSTRTLGFRAHLRPLIGIGVVEGRVSLEQFNGSGPRPRRALDGFEDSLRGLDDEFDDGDGSAELRGALFLKGRIRGDALLTLRYDSEEDPDERLFRDIEPDRFYPVYGDSSVRGYDAQSTSRLYVRVDKEKSYALWGDFTTQDASDAVELGGYHRSLTGFRAHTELGPVTLDGFASEDDARQVVREIPGRGISGPYRIGDRDILRNSEVVEIITRDRDQPSLVLDTQTQSRFTDYEIDPIDGSLLFRRPVPTLDANLDPVYIRITYEVESDGTEFWIVGVSGKVRPVEGVELGASYVEDRNPAEPLELVSGHAQWAVGPDTRLVGEIAQASHQGVSGSGKRLDLRHTGERLDAWVYWAETDEDFNNPSSRFSQGRSEAGIRSSYRLGDRTRLQADLLQTEDQLGGGRRRGAELAVERRLNDWLSGELGVRHMRETDRPADFATADPPGITPFRATTARGKLTAQVPWVPALSVFGEYEQDVSDSEQKVLAAGGELQVAPRTRAYARHEFLSSLGSRFALNTEQERRATVVGLQSEYLQDTDGFTEYRVRDVIAGRDAEAAIGLRNRWQVRPGLGLHTSLERVQTLSGAVDGDATAAALAVSYTAQPDWKGTGRIEYRIGEVQDTLLTTMGAAVKLDTHWSLLGRSLLERSTRDGGLGDDLLGRFQIGMAYRPTDSNRWNALGRYEYRFEKNADLGYRQRRNVHIVSLHGDLRHTRRLWTTGRYAVKWVEEDALGIHSSGLTQLLSGRVTYDLAERWDAGLVMGALAGEGTDSLEYALGVEVGYLIAKNFWLSGGFNIAGFEDRDLQDQNYTRPGPYLRIRFKFDEAALGWLEGGDR